MSIESAQSSLILCSPLASSPWYAPTVLLSTVGRCTLQAVRFVFVNASNKLNPLRWPVAGTVYKSFLRGVWFLFKPLGKYVVLPALIITALVYVLRPYVVRLSWFKYQRDLVLYTRAVQSYDHIRLAFRQLNFASVDAWKIRPYTQHTHGRSAATRRTARNIIDQLCTTANLTQFKYSPGVTESHSPHPYARSYYWVSDVLVRPRREEVPSGVAISMIDVDYHVDMPAMLLNHPNVYFIYTFVPHMVAFNDDEVTYRYSGRKWLYTVSGGAHYEHELWDYGSDHLTLRSWRRTVIYNIERKNVDAYHQIICLVPIFDTGDLLDDLRNGLSNFLFTLDGKPFGGRIQPEITLPRNPLSQRDIKGVHMTIEQKDVSISVSLIGLSTSATIPLHVYDSLLAASNATTNVLTVSAIKSQIMSHLELNDSELHECSVILSAYFQHLRVQPPATRVVHNYEYAHRADDLLSLEAPLVTDFMNPIAWGGVSPVGGQMTEAAAIAGRVVKVANHVPLNPRFKAFVPLFLQALEDKFGRPRLLPVHEETVWEKQDRPAQRQRLAQASLAAEVVHADEPIKTFLKSETYQKAADARMISPVSDALQLSYATYTYALADWVHEINERLINHDEVPWYAFGFTPRVIAGAVAAFCSQNDLIARTDYSRFDGRVGANLRHLESKLIKWCFDANYADTASGLHALQYNNRAVSSAGVKYDQGLGRASGSPETSILNSLDNYALAVYAWWCHSGVIHLNPGIFGGDDGLIALPPSTSPEQFVEPITALGHKVESAALYADRLYSHANSVQFLARIYGPDVWRGDPTSMADIKRSLTKLHLCVSLPAGITKAEKLYQKVLSLSFTDPNTPILGVYATAALLWHNRNGTRNNSVAASLMAYSATTRLGGVIVLRPKSDQYPNGSGTEPWMWDIAHETLDGADGGFDWELFSLAITAVGQGELSPLEMPLCYTAPVPVEPDYMMVDDINARPLKTEPPKQKQRLDAAVNIKQCAKGNPAQAPAQSKDEPAAPAPAKDNTRKTKRQQRAAQHRGENPPRDKAVKQQHRGENPPRDKAVKQRSTRNDKPSMKSAKLRRNGKL